MLAEWLELQLCNLQRQQPCYNPCSNPARDYNINSLKLEMSIGLILLNVHGFYVNLYMYQGTIIPGKVNTAAIFFNIFLLDLFSIFQNIFYAPYFERPIAEGLINQARGIVLAFAVKTLKFIFTMIHHKKDIFISETFSNIFSFFFCCWNAILGVKRDTKTIRCQFH